MEHHVSCECDKGYKPVDFSGEGICGDSISNVRETIRKYEFLTDLELSENVSAISSNFGIFRNWKNSRQTVGTANDPKDDNLKMNKRTISCEEQLSHRSSSSVKQLQNDARSRDNHKKYDLTGNNCYDSKTTIIKTPKGIRIITDVLFNTVSGRDSIPNVRETIRKYESPTDLELSENVSVKSSNFGIFKNWKNSRQTVGTANDPKDDNLKYLHRMNKRTISCEEQLSHRSSSSVKQLQNDARSRENHKKYDLTGNNCYDSKTTIIKTPKGIRIITDVLFNTVSGRDSIPNVRETNRKYESPTDLELSKNVSVKSSNFGIFKNWENSIQTVGTANDPKDDNLKYLHRMNKRTISCEEQLSHRSSSSVKQLQNDARSRENHKKYDLTGNNCYDSKTTIIKTPEGVRIITDILFNTVSGLQTDPWLGRRFETELPASRILNDFEKRSNWDDENLALFLKTFGSFH